nr:hypothetical protein [Tepidiphilus baoligensis]
MRASTEESSVPGATSSSSSTPRMPCRAARNDTPAAAQARITPTALALITAVIPPDWA